MYFQQGGQQAQIMQIIQQYAQLNQIDPKQLLDQFQKLPAEQQQQAIQQMVQTLQQGASQQPDMQQAAMAYGGYTTGIFADGGESNAGMAMGQIAAMQDKLARLQKFINSADTEVDPWVASKITLADDYLNTVADYMQYGEQQEPENEMPGAAYKRGGSTFSGNAWYGNGGTNNPGFHALPEFVQHQILSNMAYGGIHIKPANKGKFTASAKRAGMGVQEFASHVLANKDKYSSTQVKRANFAHNAAGWKKQMGGLTEGDVLDVTPDQLKMLQQGGYNFEIID